VAGTAVLACGGMFSRRLALRDDAVVAGVAAACDFVVVHVDVGPALGTGVAAFAAVRGSRMCRGLAGCRRAVVAGVAIARYAIVAEASGQPGIGGMAIAAVGCRQEVRRRLAGRRNIVVAA